MIKIGVNENVYLAVAENKVTEKGTSFILGFAEVGQEVSTVSDNPMDLLNDGSDASGESTSTNIVLFTPSLTYMGDSKEGSAVEFKKGDVRPGKDIFNDFVELKNVLAHILKRYVPNEKTTRFDVLKGVALGNAAPEAIMSAFAKENIHATAYKNLTSQFIGFITPFLGKQDLPSRLMLVRSSANNHFGTIRKRFLTNNPFFEDGKVSIPQSKLYTVKTKGTTGLHPAVDVDGVLYVPAFNSYELDKGLDSGAKISEDGDDVETQSTETIGLSATEVFTAGEGTGGQEDGLAGLSI